MILHIDMDAFFASIEQAINPRLKGKPLIVGSRANKLHTVVCAASYEAKAYGIDSGMPTKEALRLCPEARFVPAEQGRYIWTSEKILELLKEYGFELVYASIDEFQLDIRYAPQPESIGRDIRKRIEQRFNITASVGIAKNCLLAKLASKLNKPNGMAILTEKNLSRILAGLPAENLCGIGAKSSAVLNELGVKTCLDLYQKPPLFLKRAFGKQGLNLYASLHSSDSFEGLKADNRPKSIGHSYTLPRASENTGFIKAWIRLLSEMVSRRLREQNLACRTAHLWASGPEIGNFAAQKTFQAATDDGYELYLRCLKIIAKISQKAPKIRALGVTGSNLTLESFLPLFKEQKRGEEINRAVDRINTRLGEDTIYPAVIELTKIC